MTNSTGNVYDEVKSYSVEYLIYFDVHMEQKKSFTDYDTLVTNLPNASYFVAQRSITDESNLKILLEIDSPLNGYNSTVNNGELKAMISK